MDQRAGLFDQHRAPGQLVSTPPAVALPSCQIGLCIHDMVRNQVPCFIEPKIGQTRQNFAFARNGVGQHVIEGRDAVTGDNQELAFISGGIHIPDFTLA
jgi:hypothetical protein